MPVDRLCFFLTGRDDVANRLYELCLGACIGGLVVPGKSGPRWQASLPATDVRPVGFTDEEALLPVSARSFQGYRLLQEYFAFPQRFRFLEVTRSGDGALAQAATDEIELVLLLGRGEPTLESVVDASNVSLYCTPAVNLFPRRLDRIHVTEGSHEFHVVPDRTRPLDFEVYEVTEVVGYGVGSDSQQPFLPFYAAYSTDEPHQRRRTSRHVASRGWYRPRRSGEERGRAIMGTEVFLSLVDADAGAVRRQPAAAVGAGHVHESRPRAADAGGAGRRRFHPGRRRTGGQCPSRGWPEPAVRPARRRERGLACDQPSVAELPVAGQHRRRRAPRHCGTCWSCTRRARMRRHDGRWKACDR